MRLLLLLLLVPATAFAVPAGRSGQLDASATPTGLAVSDDERFVAMSHSGADGLTVFDRTAFLDGGTTLTVCSDAADVTFVSGTAVSDRFYVACAGGTVHYVMPDATAFPATWTVSDAIDLTLLDVRADVVTVDFAALDTVVHAVVQAETTYSLWTISIADDTAVQVAVNPLAINTIEWAAIGELGTPWILGTVDRKIIQISRVGAVYSDQGEGLPYPAMTGLVVTNALDQVYVSDNSEGEIWMSAATSPLLIRTEHPAVVTSPVALSLGGSTAAPFLWVGESGGDLVAVDVDGVELLSVNLDDQNAVRIAAAPDQDGAVYVVGSGGTVRMVSDRPFVSELDTDAGTLGPGDSFTLTFTANADSDYDLRVGGDLDPATGTTLDSGALTADVQSTVTLSADILEFEGDNRIFLFVDSGADSVGNDSIVVTFDGPPDAIATPTVGEADERLDLRWTSSDEPDIATFQIYVSDAAFTTDSDLPTFTATDGTVYPLDVTAGDPSTDQSLSIDGLTNATLYYIALRAIDAGGQASPFTAVVTGTPQQTCGAAECAGEPLGCSTCSSMAMRPGASRFSAWLALGLLAWLVRRR
jgi:hypothetical protein